MMETTTARRRSRQKKEKNSKHQGKEMLGIMHASK